MRRIIPIMLTMIVMLIMISPKTAKVIMMQPDRAVTMLLLHLPERMLPMNNKISGTFLMSFTFREILVRPANHCLCINKSATLMQKREQSL